MKKIVKNNENVVDVDVFSADSFSQRGLSKSPLTTEKRIENDCCIDYLKIRFDYVFDFDSPEFLSLLDCLVLKNACDEHVGVSGYEYTRVFGEDVFISWGGLYTKNDCGEFTTLLELKGHACRNFEIRGGDWFKLFDKILKLHGKCIRIDLPLDDYNHTIEITDVLQHVRDGLYVSPFRKRPKIVESNGLSITFGNNGGTRCLCIYDKKSERENADYEVLVDSWIRYESRFFHNVAQGVFLDVYNMLMNGDLGLYVQSVLKGMLELKEKTKYDSSDLDKVPTYSKWDDLVSSRDKLNIHPLNPIALTSVKKMNWEFRSTIGVSVEKDLCFMETDELDVFNGFSIMEHLDSINNQMIERVNNFRKAHNFRELNKSECINYIKQKYSEYKDGDDFVKGILSK